MDTKQRKLLNNAAKRSPKRAKRPEPDRFCWCLAVLVNGRCPKCRDKKVYRTYCRKCLRVHEYTDTCVAWKAPVRAERTDASD